MKRNFRKTPFFSIVILSSPERSAEIFRCLDSIQKSTFKNFEIIVVNNSFDPKKEKRIHQKFPFVIYLDMKSNIGIEGFSKGFIQSRGTYIFALDDDACVLPNTLQMAHTKIKTVSPRVGIIGCNSCNPSTGQYYHEDYLKNPTRALYNQTIGGTLFKREVFAKSGYYDEEFFCWMHEDDLFIRIRNAGYLAIFDPFIQVHHFDRWRRIRKMMYFFMFRNFVWLTIKYFSVWYIPLLLTRNIVTLLLLPLKKGSLTPFICGSAGLLAGFCTIFTPLQKRKAVKATIQKEYVHYYVWNKFASVDMHSIAL